MNLKSKKSGSLSSGLPIKIVIPETIKRGRYTEFFDQRLKVLEIVDFE